MAARIWFAVSHAGAFKCRNPHTLANGLVTCPARTFPKILEDFMALQERVLFLSLQCLKCWRQKFHSAGAGFGLRPGLVTGATAFDNSLVSTSYTKIDLVGVAIQQLEEAKELSPDWAILNPRDWWLLRRTKDSQGNYILGAPGTEGSRRLWDLQVIATNNMPSGQFLVGSSSPEATHIRQRMELVVEVSTSHSDWFSKNLICIRGEERMALVTRRPGAFIYSGSFTTSP